MPSQCGNFSAWVKSINYLLKYVHKGADETTFQLQEDSKRDEISNFINGRYIASTEAATNLVAEQAEMYTSKMWLHQWEGHNYRMLDSPKASQEAADHGDNDYRREMAYNIDQGNFDRMTQEQLTIYRNFITDWAGI